MTEPFSEQLLRLIEGTVDVWRVPLDRNRARTQLLLALLSPDERQRAARYHFDQDRNQFTQARAALRLILSEYLRILPQKIEFSIGSHGKPALGGDLVDSKLRFNLSHRDGLALVAVAYDREIGVDVELVRADVPVLQIAEATFSAAEVEALRRLPQAQQTSGFFNCWTRKEAYVKARGEGLSFPLKRFDVSLTPGDPAKLLSVRDGDSEVDRWTLQEIPVAENYVAALAVEGSNVKVTIKTVPVLDQFGYNDISGS